MRGRGAVLRVDLGTERITKEELDSEVYRKYLGGEGVNAWLLWEHFLKVDPKIDPLSPENVIIGGTGPLTGTGYGAGSKMKWTFKSPETGIYGDSSCGGLFSASLRWAGYDHIVITGKAKRPVYIWINDGQVELRDAGRLWGKDVDETDDLIKEEVGDSEAQTACIGRSGENLVVYTSLIVSRLRAAGKMGTGCVFGSKNLKAVAVRGTGGLDIKDPKAFFESINELAARLNQSTRLRDGWKTFGTHLVTGFNQRLGANAYRNNQDSVLPEENYRKLDHRYYIQNLALRALTCSPGCISGCTGMYRVKSSELLPKELIGEIGHKVEYGGIAAFGIMCGISDLSAVSHLWKQCSDYSVNVVELGSCCAFLMELWQRGIINEQDMIDWTGEPLNLEWGSYEAVAKIADSVALQSNKLGKLLRDGVYKAALRIEEMKGVPVRQYALYGKGHAGTVLDCRGTHGWATQFAVASRGCDHLKAFGSLDKLPGREDISMKYFGTPEGAVLFSPKWKGASCAASENWCALINSLGICILLVGSDVLLYPAELFARALSAVTGEEMTGAELELAGERAVNLEKAFNSRLGLRREDDRLCDRWMKEEVKSGPGKGWKGDKFLEQTKDEYYAYHGWDKTTSLQTRAGLDKLDMDDIAQVLNKEGALS